MWTKPPWDDIAELQPRTWLAFVQAATDRIVEVYHQAIIDVVEGGEPGVLGELTREEALRAALSGERVVGWPERLPRLRVALSVHRAGESPVLAEFPLDPNRPDLGRAQLLGRLPGTLGRLGTPWAGRVRISFASVPAGLALGFQRWWVEVGSPDLIADPDVRAILRELRAELRDARRENRAMFDVLMQIQKFAPELLGAHAQAIEAWAALVGKLDVPLQVPDESQGLPEPARRFVDEAIKLLRRAPAGGGQATGPVAWGPEGPGAEVDQMLEELAAEGEGAREGGWLPPEPSEVP